MPDRKQEQGFTLIEMLVALTVFSIAALALMRLDVYAISQTSAIADARLADIVARNEAALVTTDLVLTLGESRTTATNGGSTFDVVRRITATGDKRLMRVDIAAVQQGGRGRAVLTMVKRVTP